MQQLILEEWQQAQVYTQLMRQLPAKQSATVRKLYEQKKAQIDCLKGIYRLVAGSPAQVHGVAPKQESAIIQLRKCYGRQMRCLAKYEAKTQDPEYGSVYAGLAGQNRNHCQILLELLGAMAKL